jgi:hypothetical protein
MRVKITIKHVIRRRKKTHEGEREREFFLFLLLLFASLFTSLCMFYFSTFDVVNSLILLVCIRLPRQVILFSFFFFFFFFFYHHYSRYILPFSHSDIYYNQNVELKTRKKERRNKLNIKQIVLLFSIQNFTLSLDF